VNDDRYALLAVANASLRDVRSLRDFVEALLAGSRIATELLDNTEVSLTEIIDNISKSERGG
jgi:hypothetical protein